MSTETTSIRQARVFLVALMLFLASTLFGAGAVSADVLRPMTDAGGPGGGGASAVIVDETAQTTVPGSRPF